MDCRHSVDHPSDDSGVRRLYDGHVWVAHLDMEKTDRREINEGKNNENSGYC